MANLIKDNAYQVLGLHTIATQKEIVKKSKDIINRLKIDDLPVYPTDIVSAKELRTEQNVKEAVQSLSTPKNRIAHYFFWFQIADQQDVDAIKQIMKKEFSKAIETWESTSLGNDQTTLIHKKNLAIMYCILMFIANKKECLEKSLRVWDELIKNEVFWKTFIYLFKQHDDLNTNNEVISEFKSIAVKNLSDIYAELSHSFNDNDYITMFANTFSVAGTKISKDVISPIYQTISEVSKFLEDMNISEDGIYDEQEKKQVELSIKRLNEEFDKLKELGLYDDSKTKTMRDRAAEAIRTVVLDLHNNLQESNSSMPLMKTAENIAGTESLRERIRQDSEIINEAAVFSEHKPAYDHIISLLESGQIDAALNALNTQLHNPKLPPEMKATFQTMKDEIEERINSFGKPIKSTPSLHTINGIGNRIYGDTLYFVVFFVPVLPLSRYSLQRYGDGYRFFGKLDLHPWQKYWKYGVIIAVLGLMLYGIIAASISSDYSSNSQSQNNRTSYSQSTNNYQPQSSYYETGDYSCTSEHKRKAEYLMPSSYETSSIESAYEDLEQQGNELERLKADIDRSYVTEYSTQYQIDEYNRKINRYNAMLLTYQRDYRDAQDKADAYDQKVDAYNSYLKRNCRRR